MFKKKRERKFPIKDMFPCTRRSCVWYINWMQDTDLGTLYINKDRPDYWTWENSTLYCVSCKHFKSPDNYRRR